MWAFKKIISSFNSPKTPHLLTKISHLDLINNSHIINRKHEQDVEEACVMSNTLTPASEENVVLEAALCARINPLATKKGQGNSNVDFSHDYRGLPTKNFK